MKPNESGLNGLTVLACICTFFAAFPALEPVSARALPMMLAWQFFSTSCAVFFLWARAVDA